MAAALSDFFSFSVSGEEQPISPISPHLTPLSPMPSTISLTRNSALLRRKELCNILLSIIWLDYKIIIPFQCSCFSLLQASKAQHKMTSLLSNEVLFPMLFLVIPLASICTLNHVFFETKIYNTYFIPPEDSGSLMA